MHPVCSGCAAPCCVGRDVPVGEDEVAALASMLGVPAHAFAVDGEAGARLRRRDGDGACVFAVAVGGSYRCGVEGEAKPRACRVYPYHVAVDEAGAWTAAYGNDAVCPLPRDAAWAARLDEERPTIDVAVRAATGTSARRLPVVGDSPCFGCTTTCCLDYVVPVNAHDVWRLARALGLSWGALVEVRPTPADYMESFTLDSSGQKRAFQLRRRAGGACALLTSLPDGSHRCGVHAARPLACRLYPYRGDWTPGAPIRVVADAVCPPERRDRYEARKVFAASESSPKSASATCTCAPSTAGTKPHARVRRRKRTPSTISYAGRSRCTTPSKRYAAGARSASRRQRRSSRGSRYRTTARLGC